MLARVGGVLTVKELNRATLARQMLLAREKTPVLRAVERLAGLQAQLARPPYVGLWSRLQGFRPEDLTRLARDRKVVRATLMRCTRPTFLVDGVVAGTWSIERKGAGAALVVEPFVEIPRKARAELAAEGKALVSFCEPDARTAEVRFT